MPQLRKILTDNTTILEHQNNKQKLQILEALYIRNLQPLVIDLLIGPPPLVRHVLMDM